ncbi:MAG TPA: family 1 glycosylhydrolase, partial [Candidatus Dormibacteraeota bacterium]|nr:family 1 glycosylhydrolase [Candidatus Dormibacteraeota bacterium]
TRIADGSDAAVACDHYRRYREDLEQLAAQHQNAHRFSIEWARVEPSPGCFDGSALAHYEDVVRTCRRTGLEPVVTLHHFTLPRWLADHGGVLHPNAPRLFARYAAACAERLGSSVTWWITLNEPTVLAFMGYLIGHWPPGERSLPRMVRAMRALVRMHAAASAAVRRVALAHGWTARLSIAHQARPQRAGSPTSPLDQAAALAPNWVFNRWFLHCCMRGRLLPPLGWGEPVAGLRDSLDYIGVNYYTYDLSHFDLRSPLTLFARQSSNPTLPRSSFDWTIDPPAMRRALVALWEEFRLPLLITENGVADEHDELRGPFITDHLNALLDAVDDGADVRGYLHWTAWDNWEWAEGFTKRFGLYAVDPDTQERIPKPSASLYAEICGSRAVPSADSARVYGVA